MTGCKADIYFLADNTGSMGDIVDAVKAAGLDMLDALASLPNTNLRFGVGNYQDFPINEIGIVYGNRFHRPNAITVPAGSTVQIPFATGPFFQGGSSWPGAVAATYDSPVDHITIPTNGLYAIYAQIIAEYVGSSTSILSVRIVSNLQGLIAGGTHSMTGSPMSLGGGGNTHLYTAGEQVHVEVVNNATFDIEIRWDSEFRAAMAPDGTFIILNPYCFMHQLDPTTDQEAIASAFHNWRADRGADYPEGWVFALDQLAEQTFWRPGAIRFIIDIGDAPPHDPICMAISGLDYDITEESVTDKLVAGSFVFIGVSHSDPGQGLNDDSPAGNYEASCGPAPIVPGHADRIALATGGLVQYFDNDVDVVEAILDVVVAALGDCHNARRALPWVGSVA